ncbi:MAG: BTAD domain-containing putative transcriptional regulator [Gaiellaceae bacterium]
MDYRILGPLEAFDGERSLALGGGRQKAVLAFLLCHANEVLASEMIIDALWGEHPRPTAGKVLQNCVSALRKQLPDAADTLRTVGNGYALRVEHDELDRDRFERGLAEGRAALAAGANADAARRLRDALALWRGSPLTDFTYERFAQDEIARLEELHTAAIEDRIEAELRLGEHAELIPELETLVARHPVRERLRAQLMLALYRVGRQAEALATYRDARRALLDELGIEPGRALQKLERAILAQETTLEAVPQRATAPGRRAATPVVGREEELALLDAGLEDALAGRGRLFVVVGATGSGKTQLGDEIASHAKAGGARILWGRGWDGGGAPPFWPWIQALRDAGRVFPEPCSADEAARFRTFESVTEMLREEARLQPLLVVFDDLQAADSDSLLLIEFLASELPEMAVLMVALAREETPRLDELGRLATRTLHLGS